MNEPVFDQENPVRFTACAREDVDNCTDVETLAQWFVEHDARELEMRAHLEARRFAEIDDEDWFRRCAGALAYTSIGKRWIERRILTLGGEPPYFPTDPRARALRILNEQVGRLKHRLEELERAAAGESDG
jgi:hypothetical protein